MVDACSRWIELTDREAVGEDLTGEEAAFVREHLHSCADCRAEAEVFAGMRALVTGEHDGQRPSTKPNTKTEEPARRRRRRVAAAFAIGAAAIAAAALAVIVPRVLDSSKPGGSGAPKVAAVVSPAARVVVSVTTGGAIEIDGRLGAIGQELTQGSVLFARDGTACVEMGTSVRACLAKGSLVRVADTSASLRLELLGGKIVAELDPLPKGTSFGIVSREGSSIAVGTAFSVEVPPGDAAVVTRVLHGTVAVHAVTGPSRQVSAHEKIAAVAGASAVAATALSSVEEAHEQALLVSTPASRATGGATPVNVESDMPGATVTIDDRVVGAAPLAILLAQGEHVITVAAPSRDPVRQLVHVSGAAPIARRFEAPAPPPSAPAPAAIVAKGSADLLASARERRARGDLDGAIAAYRELFEHHGSSSEAHAALVPYGELQLSQLAEAQGALASFDRYLARRGPLEEEASFGRIRALRALGRTEDARAAAAAFVRRFPESPLAAPLRDRAEPGEKER